MLQAEYLRHHVDGLLRLSREVKDRAVAAKLREMADEFRIMLSVAEVASLAADLGRSDPLFLPSVLPSKRPQAA
jgi:hypothetical protein